MKKILLTIMLLAGFLAPATVSAQSSNGDKAMGLILGFNSRNRAPLAGIYFSYAFAEHFRVVPNIRYVFKNRSQEIISYNIDAHFPYKVNAAGNFQLYPLAGLTSASNNFKDADDVSTRFYRFGLNLGAGAHLNLSPTLRLTLEGRYSLLKNFPTVNIGLGIGYCF